MPQAIFVSSQFMLLSNFGTKRFDLESPIVNLTFLPDKRVEIRVSNFAVPAAAESTA
jgi:hypothetical protein